MRPDHQAQDWNDLAQLDPYWAILTATDKRYGGWDSDEFFAIGTVEVAAMIERFERLGHPELRQRALDFGCGVGRITRALAQHFDEAIGVDIAEDMVSRARELNADKPGVSFVVNVASDLARFDDAAFDLVFSSIVLQHVPDRSTIEGYVAEFCRVVRPGGLVMFQLPTHIPAVYRTQWRRRLYGGLRRLGVGARFLYRRLRLFPIAMSYVPEPAMVRLIESTGASVLEVDRVSAEAGVRSSTYYVTR
jgi:ubiquinone/menaquinone biosynthesis C-methylase UbiE